MHKRLTGCQRVCHGARGCGAWETLACSAPPQLLCPTPPSLTPPRPVPRLPCSHTSRFIIVYLTFLPFALWGYLGWLLLPVSVVLTFLLLGIENIGIQVCGHGLERAPGCARTAMLTESRAGS